MSKFIVCVFDNEEAAYKGSKALQELHFEGDIAVYAGAVVVKDNNGLVRIVDEADEGPIGTLGGMLIGSLIGAFGGPTGMLAGAAAGSVGGWVVDLYNVGVDAEFLDDVASVMTPGKSAVVAEVSEAWTTPLDTRMTELGGTIFRRWRMDVEDEQIEREIEATDRDLDDLEDELDAAAADAKAGVQKKVDAAKAKLKSLKEKADNKIASLKSEADAKIDALNEQIAKAKDDAKAKFQKRRDELKADYDRRAAKLKEAAAKTAEALKIG